MNAPAIAALLAPGELVVPAEKSPPPFIPGSFPDMPFAVYSSIEAMSFSGSGYILKSGEHFKVWTGARKESTAAQIFGQCVHTLVLEPDKFAGEWAIAPKVDRRYTECKEAWKHFQTISAGKRIIDEEGYRRALMCASAVLKKRAAAKLLEGAQCELSIFWIDGEYGVPCKARLDLRNGALRGIGDLKTCGDASRDEFARQVARMGYYRQQAHYWSGCEHVFNESPEFAAMIAVEDEEPNGVAVYTLPPVALQAGRREMDEALARYAKCLELGEWPGYDEEIRDLDLPRYALRDSYR